MTEALIERLRLDIAWHAGSADAFSYADDAWNVFADALLDAGDPRGTWLALEREHQRTGDAASLRRQQRLVAQHRDAWEAGLPVTLNSFRRHYAGFPGHLTVSSEELGRVAAALAHPNGRLITSLTFTGSRNGRAIVEGLSSDPAFAVLRALDFTSVPLTVAELEQLRAVPHLAKLVALTGVFGTAALRHLADGPWRLRVLGARRRGSYAPFQFGAGFSQLGRLTISSVSPDIVDDLVTSLPSLTELTIQRVSAPWSTLAALIAKRGLRRLRIGEYQARDGGSFVPEVVGDEPLSLALRFRTSGRRDLATVFAHLATSTVLDRVEDFELSCADQAPRSLMIDLVHRARFSRLRSLRLDGLDVEADALPAWLNPERLPVLDRVRLVRLSLGDEGAALLADLPQLADLSELELVNVGFTAQGWEALASSPYLAGLDALVVWTAHSDIVLRALAAAPRFCPRKLCVRGGALTLEAVAALAASPILRSVRHLELQGATLSEEILNTLMESPHLANLEVLELVPPPLAPAARDALARASTVWPRLQRIVGVSPSLWLDD